MPFRCSNFLISYFRLCFSAPMKFQTAFFYSLDLSQTCRDFYLVFSINHISLKQIFFIKGSHFIIIQMFKKWISFAIWTYSEQISFGSRAVVLNQRQFCYPGDIFGNVWRHCRVGEAAGILEGCLLEGRGQPLTTKNYWTPNGNSAKVEKDWTGVQWKMYTKYKASRKGFMKVLLCVSCLSSGILLSIIFDSWSR